MLLALAGDIVQVFRDPDPSGKTLLAVNSFDLGAHGFGKRRTKADGKNKRLRNNTRTGLSL